MLHTTVIPSSIESLDHNASLAWPYSLGSHPLFLPQNTRSPPKHIPASLWYSYCFREPASDIQFSTHSQEQGLACLPGADSKSTNNTVNQPTEQLKGLSFKYTLWLSSLCYTCSFTLPFNVFPILSPQLSKALPDRNT